MEDPRKTRLQVEEETVREYEARARARGIKPDTDRFAEALRLYMDRKLELTVDMSRSQYEKNFGAFNADHFKMRHLIEMQQQRMTTTRSAHSGIVIKSSNPQDRQMQIMAGSFDKTWEYMHEQRMHGVLWTVEVQLSLSRKNRARVVSVILLSPELQRPESKIITVGQHLEDQDERHRSRSRHVASWRYFLEEQRRFEEGSLPENRSHQNITVDGLFRLLRETVCQFPSPFGQVDGDPLIRFHLDEAFGAVARGIHLDPESPSLPILKNWVWEMVDFQDANRHRYWDGTQRMYITKSPDEEPPIPIPMDVLMRQLGGR